MAGGMEELNFYSDFTCGRATTLDSTVLEPHISHCTAPARKQYIKWLRFTHPVLASADTISRNTGQLIPSLTYCMVEETRLKDLNEFAPNLAAGTSPMPSSDQHSEEPRKEP